MTAVDAATEAAPGSRAEVAAELWDRIVAQVRALEAADWARPTPCSDWDVHDLVGHLSGVQVALDLGRAPETPAHWSPSADTAALDQLTAALAASRREWSPQQLLDELVEARDAHVSRLSAVRDWAAATIGPTGPTTEEGLYRVRMYDLWVHLTDLRSALGVEVEEPDTSPAAAVAHGFVWERVPWLYARRARAPEGSTMRLAFGSPLDVDTVVEVRDGRARLNPAADPGSCVVSADPVALTLLVSGRGDPDGWRRAGLLDWDGNRGQEFVERARLFQ